MMSPEVAVVILNYNGKKFLETFLSNVVLYSKPYEVIVVDNASTDDSVEFLEQHFADLKCIRNSKNNGYAGGYAEGLAQLSHDYFVLLNNDVEVTPQWLEPMLQMAQRNERIAAIQPKLLDYQQKNTFEYAGAAGGFIDMLGYPFCRGRVFDSLEEDNGQYNEAGPVFWASGACMFVRRSALLAVGGLDTDYFAHMEEIDLCWRMKNLGYEVYYQPLCTVYHVGGGTLHKANANKTFLNFRNSLVTLLKNDSGFFWFKIFIRLILDGIAGIKFLLEGNGKHCLAIIKAHFGFYGMIGTTLEKRKQLREHTQFKATESPFLKRNLVWQYYILGRKTFKLLSAHIH